MASVVRIDGRPWSASEAGWRAAREGVSRRVDAWQRRREAERQAGRVVRWGAVLGALLLELRALEVGSSWALALSAVMLVALIVDQLRVRR